MVQLRPAAADAAARGMRSPGRRAATLLALLLPALGWAADLQIAQFTDNPDPVAAGAIVQYTVRIDNNAPDAAQNAVLRFTVPPNATFVSATPASQNCSPVGNEVVCQLGRVGGSATSDERNIVVSLRALGPGPDTLAPTATVSASNEVNPGNDTQTALTTVASGANLALAKAGAPDPVVGGANVTYTLTASNAGPNAATGLRITDNLPPSVLYVSATGTGWTCEHRGANPGGVVICERPGPHAVGAAVPPVRLIGTVQAAGGTITNSASIEPATLSGVPGIEDPDTTNNLATRDVAVLPGADVRVDQKSITSPLPATAGSAVTFRIQPRNGGPAAATAAVVTDVLPSGWALVSATGAGWACTGAGRTVTCTRPSLPAGSTNDITIVATAPDNAAVGPTGTTYTNTASIASAVADPIAGNNSASVDAPVLPDGADLRINKTKTPNPVALGSNLTSRVNVTNNGPRRATGPLRVVELLTGETFVSASGNGWVCSASGGQVVCDHPNAAGLAVGAALPELVIVTVATAADATAGNTACTGGSVPAGASASARPPLEGDANPTNDCATAGSTSTTVRPDLAITKVTSTPAGADKVVTSNEGAVTYTLVVTNRSPGSDAATGVRIIDTVPGFITGRTPAPLAVVTPGASSTARFACNSVNERVTCNQTAGQLAPGESVTVAITVQRPLTDGSFVNTARVTNLDQGDPVGGNNNAQDTVLIDPIADVEMSGKTVTPNPVRAGETAAYVLSFRNNGPSTAQNVVLTDTFTLPAGDTGATVVSVASSAAGSTCSIAEGAVLNAGANSFTCSIGALANGVTESVTLQVRPNFVPGNTPRVFSNTARVTTTTPESPDGSDNGNNVRTATLNVDPATADLLINKTDAADPVRFDAGATFVNYRLTVNNRGPSFATGVRVAESIRAPAGKRVRFVCDVADLGSTACNSPSLCDAANVTSAEGGTVAFSCSVPAGTGATGLSAGELAVDRSKNVFVRFEFLDPPSSNGDVFTNTGVASANEPDPFPANNTESEPTTVRQRLNLRVTKTATPTTVTLNQPFTWQVAVTNTGPGTSVQTNVTDTLPPGIEVTGPVTYGKTSPAASGPCTVSGVAVSCVMGQLDADGVATLSIPARIVAYPDGGTRTNTATVDTGTNVIGGIDTNANDNTADSTITVTRSSIAGTVFEDRERNGSDAGTPQGAGAEPRLPGVTITLTGTDAYGNPISRSTVTDADGNYRFTDLPPSDGAGYTLTQTQPAGFVSGPASPPGSGPLAPSSGGAYAGSVGGNSVYSGVVLGGADDAARYHFPELALASLSGFVYIDSDNSGVRGPGDAPVPGATVRLLDAGTGNVVAAATTDAGGAYQFSGLDPRVVYTLEQPLPATPAGLVNGPVTPGLIGGGACASGCTAAPGAGPADADRITAIDLSRLNSGTDFNFGERLVGGISGTVFIDRDRDGVLDPMPDDGRIAGVTLSVVAGTSCAGTPVATTTTDADGNYRFTGLPTGVVYTICQTQPAGYADGSPNAITLPPLTADGTGGHDFAERVGSIAGAVYLDADNDGQFDAGESGLAGVTVTLTGTDIAGNPVSRTTTTGPDGRWRFDDLLAAGPGGYTVTEPTQPAGTTNGITRAGSAGGTATGVTVTPSAIGGIPLGAGADAVDYLFGESDTADLVVGKTHAPARLTADNPAEIRVVARNAGAAPTVGSYTFTDRLPAGITLAAAPSGSGWTCTGSAGDAGFSCTSSAVLAAGADAAVVTAPVRVSQSALAASPVVNVVLVEGGGEAPGRQPTADERDAFLANPASLPACTVPASANACRDSAEVQAPAGLAGTVWFDIGPADALLDGADRRLEGWVVEVVDPTTGGVIASTRTAADGSYRIGGLLPGVPLSVRFREPASGIVFGTPVNGERVPGSPAACDAAAAIAGGTASSCVVAAPNSQLSVVLASGQTLAEQSLPVDPTGVVYDSVSRAPVAGATVTIAPVGACPGYDPAQHLVNIGLGGFSVNGTSASMVTGPEGLYQYLFTPTAPATCAFALTVTPPPAFSFVSTAIPPQAGTLAPGGAAGTTFEVQPNAQAPSGPVGPATQHWLVFNAGSAVATVVHNHLPLDPVSNAVIALSKTGDQRIVELGDTLRYTLTLRHVSGPGLAHTTLVDRLPRGFTYIAGTARVNGAALPDPTGGAGPMLVFETGALAVGQQLVLTYRVRVGVGSMQGDGVNRAIGHGCGVASCVGPDGVALSGVQSSNEGAYRVLVTGGVFTADACLLGKIYVDCNGNHLQDPEELGIPGVRLYLQDGTFLVSDSEGKYSMCGLPPRSHVLKVDPLTLPRGSRLTTSSNRNLGDAGSLWLDLKNGELHRGDFIEGSCSNPVLEQVKARRAQGEVRSIENERTGGPALRFDSKPGVPPQGTDPMQAPVVRPRPPGAPPTPPSRHENDSPVPSLPMNRPASEPSAGGTDAR